MTMGELGYAFFMGFVLFFAAVLLIGTLLKNFHFLAWLIPSFLVGLLTFFAFLFELTTLLTVLMLGVFGSLLVLVFIYWVSGKLK